jgi:hypothetical protein
MKTNRTGKLSDFSNDLEEFARSEDFVLRAAWEALCFAPTVTLADGSTVRPLTGKLVLRRFGCGRGEHFAIHPFEEVRDEAVMAYRPEQTWRVTGQRDDNKEPA